MTVLAASGPVLGRHGVHLLMLLLPTVSLAAFAAIADVRQRSRDRAREPFVASRALATAAAVCGLVATAVHVRVAPEHFHEAVVFGAFFVVTATCQLAWSALMLTRPRMSTAVAGAVGNGAVLLLWVYTRAVAVPLGPDAGRPEEIGALDVVATVAEAATVLVVIAMLLRVTSAASKAMRA